MLGERGFSNEIHINLVTPIPNAPTNLRYTLQPDGKTVLYEWNAPLNGPTPDGYKAYWGTTPGGPYTDGSVDLGNTTSLSYTYTNSIEFYAVIVAYYGLKESSYSNEIHVATANAPTNLRYTLQPDGRTILYEWDAPLSRPTPDGYKVYWGPTLGGPYSDGSMDLGNVTSKTMTYDNDVEFYFIILTYY